jgi:hypothetical protein
MKHAGLRGPDVIDRQADALAQRVDGVPKAVVARSEGGDPRPVFYHSFQLTR